nr:hypothetical protein [Candidatus Mycoplasma haematolamae]
MHIASKIVAALCAIGVFSVGGFARFGNVQTPEELVNRAQGAQGAKAQ